VNISFRWLFAAALIAMGSSMSVSAAENSGRPNVLFIMADDLNMDVGTFGSTRAITPELDALAARGVRFTRAYAQYPVCNPSRVSLLSGLRPVRTGVLDLVTPTRRHLKTAVMLPQLFRLQGYKTVRIGKIFHAENNESAGAPEVAVFQDPLSWDLEIPESPQARRPPREQIIRDDPKSGTLVLRADDADTWDGRAARLAAAQIDSLESGKRPWFLAVGFRRPHVPLIAPERYHDLYRTASIELPTTDSGALDRVPDVALTYRRGIASVEAAAARERTRSYLASVSFMDAQVGVIMSALRQSGALSNTIIVFVSDHGLHLGEHGEWRKMTLFEEANRVPLIIAAPNAPMPGSASRAIVELIDLYPTLADLAGLKAPAGLDGKSLTGLLRNPKMDVDSAACSELLRSTEFNARGLNQWEGALDPKRRGVSLRTDRWRYTTWFDGSRELYDHMVDPQEQRNLAADERQASLMDELNRRATTICGSITALVQ